jgi:hypothetical protein
MKIFWSWQSDTPGKIGRHFVREAIENALTELNEDPTIEESDRPDRLELDHDRKGVPGSPDLVSTILKKIEESKVFIADVTPVGKRADGRALLNPNVAIELGYALAKVGDNGLLMVLNTSYGDRESLPFDLRHKAGPILFNLGADAKKEETTRVQRELTQSLKIALRECLRQVEDRPSATHIEIPRGFSVAQYFKDGEVLAERENMGGLQLRYNVGPLLYLRVIPTRVMPPLRDSDITELVFGIKLAPLNANSGRGGYWGRNLYGGITYDFTHEANVGQIITSSQIFHNRELWGIDSTFFDESKQCINSVAFEKTLDAGLRHYLQFAREKLNIESPLEVEAGISRVRGFKMAMSDNTYWGPVYKLDIQARHTLRSFEDSEINRVLLAIFDEVFDAVGKRRPANFRGFPPIDKSGSAGA